MCVATQTYGTWVKKHTHHRVRFVALVILLLESCSVKVARVIEKYAFLRPSSQDGDNHMTTTLGDDDAQGQLYTIHILNERGCVLLREIIVTRRLR